MARLGESSEIRVGLIQFPGSNCDADCFHAFQRYLNINLLPVWHQEPNLPPLDALILPGGFSYGDYLRGGALASHARIMPEIRDFAKKGGAIIGICNGFQILTEMGLLPGVLLKNRDGKFICQDVDLKVEPGSSVYQRSLAGQTLRIPIAHGEGRYFVTDDELRRINSEGQVVFRYSANGRVDETTNPNGSSGNIAGVVSANGKILGMMPHPERAADRLLGGSDDGLAVLRAFVESL
ncbi:MAG: phosphoribosylformylglycinamidine synthase subunit PurQ [Oligoflexus sp.]